jgi:hypothetical protein
MLERIQELSERYEKEKKYLMNLVHFYFLIFIKKKLLKMFLFIQFSAEKYNFERKLSEFDKEKLELVNTI